MAGNTDGGRRTIASGGGAALPHRSAAGAAAVDAAKRLRASIAAKQQLQQTKDMADATRTSTSTNIAAAKHTPPSVLRHVEGDLLTSTAQYIVHQTNCTTVHGKAKGLVRSLCACAPPPPL
jgi:hypothetical protein